MLKTEKIPLDYVRSYNNVVVYGAGKAARQVILYLQNNEIIVSAVVVTETQTNAKEFCGIKVYSIQESAKFLTDSVVIVGVTSKYADKIVTQLTSGGVENIITIPDA